MSRTFRRKNYEQETGKVAGSSICGYYTYRDWHFDQYGNFFEFFRVPTKEEAFKKFKEAHGDGVIHFRTFTKEGRRQVQKQHRASNNKIIIDFIKGVTQDVIHTELPIYPKQHWYY